eukprot:760859-Hanusia_phi.AAC.3
MEPPARFARRKSSVEQVDFDEVAFRQHDFRQHIKAFRIQLWIVALLYLLAARILSRGDKCGGEQWLLHVHASLFFLSGLISLLSSLPFLLNFFEGLIRKTQSKDVLLIIYFSLMFQLEIGRRAVADMRRSLSVTCRSPYVNLSIDFHGQIPWKRTCFDSDPEATITQHCSEFGCEDGGCVSRLIYPDGLTMFALLGTFLPISAGIDGSSAFYLSVIQLSSLLLAGLLTGINFLTLMSGVLLHAVATGANSLICDSRITQARDEFFRERALKLAVEHTNQLLSTLIPRSLHSRLKDQKTFDFVGNTMKCCTVMFVSLSPCAVEGVRTNTRDVFRLVKKIFADFDNIVEEFGMFKYHHVFDHYVVACPRTAYPFQEPLDEEEYQRTSSRSMVLLAQELINKARMYKSHQGGDLWVKVGISLGEVAGAVVGQQRRFYCLFGDAVNTGARMCSYSEAERIHCSQSFAEVMERFHPDIPLFCRGLRHVKGKGKIKTYYVDFDQVKEKEGEGEGERVRRKSDINEVMPIEDKMEKLSPLVREGSRSDDANSQHFSYCDSPSSIHSWISLSEDEKVTSGKKGVNVSKQTCRFECMEVEKKYYRERFSLKLKNLSTAVVSNFVRIFVTYYNLYSLDAVKRMKNAENKKLFHFSQRFFLTCLVLLFCTMRLRSMWTNVESAFSFLRFWKRVFCIYNALYLLTMLAFLPIVHATGWILIFTPSFTVINLMQSGVSVRQMFTFVVLFIPLCIYFITSQTPKMNVNYLLLLLTCTGFSYSHLRQLHIVDRERWKSLKKYQHENNAVLKILNNLFPESIAKEIVEYGEIASEFRNAAVLYLDLCNYTELTARQEAIKVAQLIHSVFSQFDEAVQARNIFKMDTIGDAYICACWIDDSNQRQVCKRMVSLARDLVEIIERVREEFSVSLACRIGIATGKCLAGAIGKLQPRYQIMGEAVELAHELEAAAEHQGINVSEQVKQILRVHGGEDCGLSKLLQGKGGSLTGMPRGLLSRGKE